MLVASVLIEHFVSSFFLSHLGHHWGDADSLLSSHITIMAPPCPKAGKKKATRADPEVTGVRKLPCCRCAARLVTWSKDDGAPSLCEDNDCGCCRWVAAGSLGANRLLAASVKCDYCQKLGKPCADVSLLGSPLGVAAKSPVGLGHCQQAGAEGSAQGFAEGWR